jgi:lipopolysaccharide transport system ATP-binding protein
MSEVAGHGRTVLFVSHQLGLVSRLCASAILLEAGRVKAQGPTDAVIGAYNISTVTEDALLRFKPPSEPRPLQPTWAAAYTSTGAPARVFRSSEPINLALGYRGEKFGSARLGMVISRSDGQVVLTTHSSDDASSLPLKTGEGALACTLPANLLAPGVYLISYAADIPMQEVLFREDNAYSFTVTDEGAVGGEVIDGRAGLIRLGLRWSAPDYAPSA